MKKFMLALFVAAGLASVGVAVGAAFEPAAACGHRYANSRWVKC
jgi:hypothetical protein